jgi:hypothetical protein|nr:MAG TPA: putative membrane protein [Caudoviricetes sp.]
MSSQTNNSYEIDNIVNQVESLPEEERSLIYQKLEIYQGDLPHPKILEGYNQLYPDAAKKIIDNGIAETEHRRDMERRYLSANIRAHTLGQILGFIIAILIIVGGIYLILKGHQVSGSILSGVSALGVIGMFTGNSSNDKKGKKEDDKE